MEKRMHDFDNFSKQAGEREPNERNGKKSLKHLISGPPKRRVKQTDHHADGQAE